MRLGTFGGLHISLAVLIEVLAIEGETGPDIVAGQRGSCSSASGLFHRFNAPPLEPGEGWLRGRPYLAGSDEPGFPEHVLSTDAHFPGFFEASEQLAGMSLEEVARSVRSFLDAELTTHGCLLLRGLPLSSPGSFSRLLRATGYNLTRYIGGVTLRTEEEAMVYSASNEDSALSMDLHQDNVYWPTPPEKLFFLYEQPAVDGLNPMLDARRFAEALPPEVAEKLERLQVQYVNFYPDASDDDRFLPWQQSFNTTDKQVVEKNLRGGFSFEWDGRGLRKWNTMSAFKTHPKTGERVWANMIQANHASVFHANPVFPELAGVPFVSDAGSAQFQYPYTVRYGDGSEIEYEVIKTLRSLAWQQARGFKAQPGDLLVVDNYLVQHSRLSYTPPRKFWMGISLD